jgi:ABC-type transporter Mla subunit MlaD
LTYNINKLTQQQIKGDNNLEELIKSLSGHIDSMQGSVKQVDGIVEALARAKGAVQARLFDHLDATQYEALVLGSND